MRKRHIFNGWHMKPWVVRHSDMDRLANSKFPDEGRKAFRARHDPSEKCIPIPFATKKDAERCVRILNKEIPCDSRDPAAVVDALLERYSNAQGIVEYLVGNSCHW